MTLGLAEALVDVIDTYVNANIVTKLASLSAEYADQVTLAPPVKTYRGIKSLQSIPNYPAFYVFSPEQNLRPWGIAGATAAVEVKPKVFAGMLVIDADEEILQLRLYRYGRALVELFLAAQGAALLGEWSLSTDEDWSIDTQIGQTGAQASPWVGEVAIGLRANKIETM